jgi:hypothetical protein
VVSGRDRHPAEHEPRIGARGRLELLAVVLLILAGALGWMLV